jgi:hypothetical protein
MHPNICNTRVGCRNAARLPPPDALRGRARKLGLEAGRIMG